jgi:hypothetical protein
MLPTKFRFTWLSGFREDFLEINQSETRIVCGGQVCLRIGTKWTIFTEDLPKMLPTKFRFIWQYSFRGEEFYKSANQKQESSVAATFVNGSGRNEHSLQRTFHRCFQPSFGSFGQAVSEEKIFKNRPIINKNYLCRPCLLMDREKMSKVYRGPSIDASYQVSVHLAKGFQRRRLKCEKLTDDRWRTPSDGKRSHCLCQGELKGILKCEYLHVIYSINMLHYISIS